MDDVEQICATGDGGRWTVAKEQRSDRCGCDGKPRLKFFQKEDGRLGTRKRRDNIYMYLCTQGFIHPAGVKLAETKAGLGMVHRLDRDYEFPERATHTMATRQSAGGLGRRYPTFCSIAPLGRLLHQSDARGQDAPG